MFWMLLENLTKGAFGLEIPESMQLADALIEECLRFGGSVVMGKETLLVVPIR